MTPILVFIDFDGVLLPIRGSRIVTDALVHSCESDWRHVASLAMVLHEYPESRVVVSSHWRLFYSREELERVLAPMKVYDISGPEGYTRYREIADYAQRVQGEPCWIALDDNSDMWPECELWRLVRCQPWRGLDDPTRLMELRTKLEIVRRASDLGEVRRRMFDAFPP